MLPQQETYQDVIRKLEERVSILERALTVFGENIMLKSGAESIVTLTGDGIDIKAKEIKLHAENIWIYGQDRIYLKASKIEQS